MANDSSPSADDAYSFHPSRIHGEPATRAERERREEYLERLLEVLKPEADGHYADPRLSVEYESWCEWLEGTGELPPDFKRMPAVGELPNPLRCEEDGEWIRIADLGTWERQRERIETQLQYWVYREWPPAPDNFRAVELDTRSAEGRRRGTYASNSAPITRRRSVWSCWFPTARDRFPSS